jgi:hypothetical protein
LLDKLQTKRSEKTADSTNPNHNSRGVEDLMLDFVRPQNSDLDLFKFNDMTDHDINVSPGDIWDQLQEFNCEYFDNKMQLEQNLDKKFFTLTCDEGKLSVKIKFMDLNNEEDEP